METKNYEELAYEQGRIAHQKSRSERLKAFQKKSHSEKEWVFYTRKEIFNKCEEENKELLRIYYDENEEVAYNYMQEIKKENFKILAGQFEYDEAKHFEKQYKLHMKHKMFGVARYEREFFNKYQKKWKKILEKIYEIDSQYIDKNCYDGFIRTIKKYNFI